MRGIFSVPKPLCPAGNHNGTAAVSIEVLKTRDGAHAEQSDISALCFRDFITRIFIYSDSEP